jgi:hypothetical protein
MSKVSGVQEAMALLVKIYTITENASRLYFRIN